jgi:excisionase family DNA binding protein
MDLWLIEMVRMNVDRIKTRLDKEPTIRELNVIVWDVLQELVGADLNEVEVMKRHCGLEHEGILAAISYAVLVARTAGVGLRMRDVRAEIEAKLRSLRGSGVNATVSPRLLSVKQAAIYLDRTERAIRHLIYRGELPVIRKGRRLHLDRQELDRLIEKGKI